MSRFQTLMQREWMQHHRAWLLIMLVPPVVILLLLTFGSIDMNDVPPLQIAMVTTGIGTLGVFGIFAAATLFQLPGLARRDRQDRSIEFWLSLPTSHSSSIGATLLMHLLLMPLLALGVGYLFSQMVGLIVISRVAGISEWAHLPWLLLVQDGLLTLLRAAFGVVLAIFWLSPLLLLTMVASAWLKRWGTAVLVLTLTVGHAVLAKFYGIQVIGETLQGLILNAERSLVTSRGGHYPGGDPQVMDWLEHAPRLLFDDAVTAAGNLVQPLFVFAAVFSAACFWLLVLRRSRSG